MKSIELLRPQHSHEDVIFHEFNQEMRDYAFVLNSGQINGGLFIICLSLTWLNSWKELDHQTLHSGG